MELSYYFNIVSKLLIGTLILLFYVNLFTKKQFSQMTPLDFTGNFILGSIVCGPLHSEDLSFTTYIIQIFIGLFIVEFLDMLGRRIHLLRKPILGKPFLLIKDGRFLIENWKKNKNQLDVFDIASILRTQEIFTLQGIRYAQVESNGQLTVLKKKQESMSAIVFKEGKILKEELAYLEKDADWLLAELASLSIPVEEVFAIEGTQKGIFVIKNDGTSVSSSS